MGNPPTNLDPLGWQKQDEQGKNDHPASSPILAHLEIDQAQHSRVLQNVFDVLNLPRV